MKNFKLGNAVVRFEFWEIPATETGSGEIRLVGLEQNGAKTNPCLRVARIWLHDRLDVGDRQRNDSLTWLTMGLGCLHSQSKQQKKKPVGRMASSNVVLWSVSLWSWVVAVVTDVFLSWYTTRMTHFVLFMGLMVWRKRQGQGPSYLKCPWVMTLLQNHIPLQDNSSSIAPSSIGKKLSPRRKKPEPQNYIFLSAVILMKENSFL